VYLLSGLVVIIVFGFYVDLENVKYNKELFIIESQASFMSQIPLTKMSVVLQEKIKHNIHENDNPILNNNEILSFFTNISIFDVDNEVDDIHAT